MVTLSVQQLYRLSNRMEAPRRAAARDVVAMATSANVPVFPWRSVCDARAADRAFDRGGGV
eukprot:1150679-Lingulodinium_polyedra.AAC.1